MNGEPFQSQDTTYEALIHDAIERDAEILRLRAEIARLTQDADTIRAAERERCARIAEATMEAAAEAFDLSARAEGFMGISSRALARPHVAAAVTAIAAAIRGENP